MKKLIFCIWLFVGFSFNSVFAQFGKFDYLSSLIDDGLHEQALKGIQTHVLKDENDVLWLWYLTVKIVLCTWRSTKSRRVSAKSTS